jgi:DNA modification methylase
MNTPTQDIHAADSISRLNLDVEWRAIGGLTPQARNARTHSEKQIQQIATSIRQFGFTNPVLVDAQGHIIAGHGRVEAAKLLGMGEVPTIRLDHLSEAQKRAYVLADNRLAELAGWDRELLALELGELAALDLDFDIGVTGFDTAAVDLLLDEKRPAKPNKEDEVPEPLEGPPVTQPGDLWCLGPHRLYCGDARDGAAYQRLLDGKQAQMVFTDPPYNVAIDGHVCGNGAIHHREFAMASGEMSEGEFTDFLTLVLKNIAHLSADGSIHFICMDWRHLREVLAAGHRAYDEFKNLIVWNKDNAGMGSFYRSKHEMILVFKNGKAAHINNFGLGEKGRYRTNVWDYPGVNSMKAGRMDELAMHPTVKPVGLVADAIRDCSQRKQIVLDAFMGSGTTLIAAEKTGRLAYGLELDPAYIDVAIRRYQAYAGKIATLAGTGQTFAEVAAARGALLPDGGKASTGAVPAATADVPTEPDESPAKAAAGHSVLLPENSQVSSGTAPADDDSTPVLEEAVP